MERIERVSPLLGSEPGFLVDAATVLQDADLATGFGLDRLGDETHGVHVLDLAPRAEVGEITAGAVFLGGAKILDAIRYEKEKREAAAAESTLGD